MAAQIPNMVVFDLEVENNQYYGAIASPMHEDNYVVAAAWAVVDGENIGDVESRYASSKDEEPNLREVIDAAGPGGILIAHNAPFDMLWLIDRCRDAVVDFLASGGRVFCTAYAEYLLSNQQHTYPKLDEIAPTYGGTHKIDAVKLLWEQGKKTSEIDPELLLDYLAGPNGDVINTARVFIGQLNELRNRGMLDGALHRMEGLMFSTFAMSAGLHVDREVAEKQRAEIEQEVSKIRENLRSLRNFPREVEESIKETSGHVLSAWIYGGAIPYRKRVVVVRDGVPVFEKTKVWKYTDGSESPVGELLEGKEVIKYSRGKNAGMPKEFTVDSTEPKMRWEEQLYETSGLVDFSKLPQEFADDFARRFGTSRVDRKGKQIISTSSDALELLMTRPEIPDNVKEIFSLLLRLAKLEKDLGTYYVKEAGDGKSGMLQYLTEHNVVYHQLNHTSTVTGRLSSTRPNLQNIPRGDTSDVKRMFNSRFDDREWLDFAEKRGIIPRDLAWQCRKNLDIGTGNGAIIEADYSALEVVTLAAFSKDENLCKVLTDGIDPHCMRLAQQLGEPYEDVLRKCKDETHPEHKRYKQMRTDIKPKAFAYQYGATAHGIAFSTGCSVEEAQAFIDAEKALFPQVEEWYENCIFAEVERTKTLHRELDDSGVWRLYGRGFWVAPGGTHYEFREYPKTVWVNGKESRQYAFKPTQLRNYPIQGESGFFVQVVSGQVMRWLVAKNFFNGRAFIINQVHDALYFDVHTSVLRQVAYAVKHIMESLPTTMKSLGYDLKVPFPAAVEVGKNMLEKEHYNV